MALLFVIILINLVSISAKIDVSILDWAINGVGLSSHTSTVKELKEFGISLISWKRFFKNYKDRSPEETWETLTNVYYNDPTPYGDLFEKGKEIPTHTKVELLSAKILNRKIE